MSEYQYYEFRTVDRPLSQKEMAQLRALSSRAEISSTRFSNEYSYGNFRGEPMDLLEQYFDVHLYVANWGTHQIAFRLPRGLVDADALKAYEFDGEFAALEVYDKDDYVIVNIRYGEEGGWSGWEEGEEYLDDLMPLRAEILSGDLRPLYLGWLACANAETPDDEGEDKELIEPPVPPGLDQLTPAQEALVDYINLEEDLLTAAAQGGAGKSASTGPTRDEMKGWLARVPAPRKDSWLLGMLQNGEPSPRFEALQEFQKVWNANRPKTSPEQGPRRTLAQLRGSKEVEEPEERDTCGPVRDYSSSPSSAAQEASLWTKVEAAIKTAKAKEYDQAVQWLGELKNMATRKGQTQDFTARIRKFRETHARKTALIQRLDNAGLK